MRELELSKNWPGDKFFKLRNLKFWERQFYLSLFLRDLEFSS